MRAVIPGGLTPFCQPLDLTVNRSFKAKLRQVWSDMWAEYGKYREEVSKSQQNLNMIVQAVKKAWNEVSEETIGNGFRMMESAIIEGQ